MPTWSQTPDREAVEPLDCRQLGRRVENRLPAAHRSPEHFVEIFRDSYGPTERGFASLDEGERRELAAEMEALVREHDALGLDGGPGAVPSTYLEAVAIRSG